MKAKLLFLSLTLIITSCVTRSVAVSRFGTDDTFIFSNERVDVRLKHIDRTTLVRGDIEDEMGVLARLPLLTVFLFTLSNKSETPITFSISESVMSNDAHMYWKSFSYDEYNEKFPQRSYIRKAYSYLFTGENNAREFASNYISERAFFFRGQSLSQADVTYGFLVFPQVEMLSTNVTLIFPPLYNGEGEIIKSEEYREEVSNTNSISNEEGKDSVKRNIIDIVSFDMTHTMRRFYIERRKKSK